MISWTDVEVRQLEHEQRVQRVNQAYWQQAEPQTNVEGWRPRMLNTLGGWLIELGSRMQTHTTRARQVTQPCP